MGDVRLGTPKNVNDAIQDRTIRHMFYLEAIKTRQSRQVIAYLDDIVIPNLLRQLNERLARIEAVGFDRGEFTTRRITQMIDEFQNIINEFGNLNNRIQGELFDLAMTESAWQLGVLKEEVPINILYAVAAPETIRQVLINKPFDGRTLQQWFDRLQETTKARLVQEIQKGVTEGQTTAQIVRNIQGTRALKYKDGILATTRAQTNAVVRSAVAHASNTAREEVFSANSEFIKGVQWISTLDSRTCAICAPLDGKVYKIGEGVRPPIHVSCRCAITAVTKSYREMGIDIDDIPPSTRSSMNGQVPSDITYNQWLKGQPIEIQNDALGKTRAKLFRDGGLDISQFTIRNDYELTLDQLRAKEPQAFIKAGIA